MPIAVGSVINSSKRGSHKINQTSTATQTATINEQQHIQGKQWTCQWDNQKETENYILEATCYKTIGITERTNPNKKGRQNRADQNQHQPNRRPTSSKRCYIWSSSFKASSSNGTVPEDHRLIFVCTNKSCDPAEHLPQWLKLSVGTQITNDTPLIKTRNERR